MSDTPERTEPTPAEPAPTSGGMEAVVRMLAKNQELLLENAAFEKQRLRQQERWNRFKAFAIMIPIVVVVFFYTFSISNVVKNVTGRHVGVVRINGEISGSESGVSAAKINPLINSAMANKYSAGLVLEVNSPGGSPAQAMIIRDNLIRLRQEHPDKKVYAVAEDLDASAAYLISLGADEIWVQRSSLVGSIGVIWNSWGVKKELLDKLMIERRARHAGKNKARFDPFEPEKAEDVAKLEGLLSKLHADFISMVKESRGDRLKINDDTFSGDFWLGQDAVDMGLADAVGGTDALMRAKFPGVDSRREYAPSQFDQLFKHLGASLGTALGSSMAKAVINEAAPAGDFK